MNKVTLAVPHLRLHGLLQKFLESAERGTRKPDNYFVIDNGCQLGDKMARGEVVLPANTVVANHGRHMGVAGAWNLALNTYPDWVIFSNDDVELHPDTIQSLVTAAEENADAEFIFPQFNPGAMFCVFLIKHVVIDKIGGFDEQFHPAYFEDNDFHHRMKKAGIREYQAPNASYDHVVSATLKSFNEQEMAVHHEQFNNNRTKYIAKWGNVPGLEAYDVPRT